MMKYRWVDLLRSNRLRYDSSSPGKRTQVMGSHAHCRYSYFVMDGMTIMAGFCSRLTMKLL